MIEQESEEEEEKLWLWSVECGEPPVGRGRVVDKESEQEGPHGSHTTPAGWLSRGCASCHVSECK